MPLDNSTIDFSGSNNFDISDAGDYCPPKPETMIPFNATRVNIF